MQLVVHVGTEKTGSTSIQEALWRHRDLRSFAAYGHIENRRNNFSWVVACTDYPRDLVRWYPKTRGEAFAETRRNLEMLLTECDPDCKVVVSSEHLSSRLTLPEEFAQFQALCRGFTTKIIIYFRPQVDLLRGLNFESVKAGQTKLLPDSPLDKRGAPVYGYDYYDYWSQVIKWRAVADEVEVCSYDALDNYGVITDFFNRVGVNSPYSKIQKPTYNATLSAPIILFLAMLNEAGSQFPAKDIIPLVDLSHDNLPKYLGPLELYNRISEEFFESNSRVESEYKLASPLTKFLKREDCLILEATLSKEIRGLVEGRKFRDAESAAAALNALLSKCHSADFG